MANAPNAWLLITLFNVVVQVGSLGILWLAAICRCNAAIHTASVMNQHNIAPKVVQLIHNARAAKCVQLENAEADAIQEPVWKVNYARMVHALLAVEIIWIVQAIALVLMENARIHAS